MPHWCSPSPTSRSPATRSFPNPVPSESFEGSFRGGMTTPGGTRTPDVLPLGIGSGLPLIRCPECDGYVEEYVLGLGGSITGNPSNGRRNEAGVHGGCSFFKILRERGLLDPEPQATPEQGQGRGCLAPAPDVLPLGIGSGLPLIRCPECGGYVEEYVVGLGGSITGNPSNFRRNEAGVHGGCSFKTQEEYEAILRERGLLGPAATPEQGQGRGCLAPETVMFAAVEDLRHEIEELKLANTKLKAAIEDFKGNLGADKWFFVANAVVVLFVVVSLSV